MKGFKKVSKVVLILVVISLLLAPVASVYAGEEDIPRIFSTCATETEK